MFNNEEMVPKKKRGRPINERFEACVMERLISLKMTETDSSGKKVDIEVLANAVFNYELFRVAAEDVRNYPEFKDDERLKAIKFSNGWVQKLKKHYKLRRRRCSTKLKNKPSEEEVRNQMQKIQKIMLDNEITAAQVFNEDETAIDTVAELLFQYVPSTATRAADCASSESRFTTMLGSSGEGIMLPTMIILKCGTEDKVDLSGEQTLEKLRRERLNDGTWEPRQLFRVPITDQKTGKVYDYVRPYLIQRDTFNIITVQHKAWNDQVGQLLRVKHQLKPWKGIKSPDKKCLMVEDNVSFHKTQQVKDAYAEANWLVEIWPPNMTDELQPMDINVNVIFKSIMRRLR